MKRDRILKIIRELSYSQGFYGRLYRALINGSEESESYLNYLESLELADELALVLAIEG